MMRILQTQMGAIGGWAHTFQGFHIGLGGIGLGAIIVLLVFGEPGIPIGPLPLPFTVILRTLSLFIYYVNFEIMFLMDTLSMSLSSWALKVMWVRLTLDKRKRGPLKTAPTVPFKIGWWVTQFIWPWFHLPFQSVASIWPIIWEMFSRSRALAEDVPAIDY